MKEKLKLSSIKSIYFIGIGGIGMSALARHFNYKNIHVEGYDKVETHLTKKLVEEGIEVHYLDDPDLIPTETDLVIYTPAIPDRHRQLTFWKASQKPLLKRSQALGLLTQDYKTIAVAGTHGKTTTSALMTHCLKYLGIDISAFVGGIMQNYDSNFMSGDSNWIVVEADEFDRSFLHLNPDVVVLISVDPDHLDIYGNHNDMLSGFSQFLGRVKEGGLLVVHNSIQSIFGTEQLERVATDRSMIFYGGEDDTGLMESIANCGNSFFAGKHNVENATAVVRVIESIIGYTPKLIDALRSFAGIKRRFERIYESDSYLFIDDYAHHPTEIQSAIQAVRSLAGGKKIIGIFQPHLYSRTRDFAEGFANALSQLDKLILLDIYPAREDPIPGVTASLIFDQVELKDKWRSRKEDVLHVLEDEIEPVILTIGAGDIDTIIKPIKEFLELIDE